MAERFNLSPFTGGTIDDVTRYLRDASTRLNAFMRQSFDGPFFVWDRGCLSVPESATISTGEEIVFDSPFVGNGTIIATVVSAQGNVHIGLNDTDYGTIDNSDTSSEIIYEVQVNNLTEGLNSFQIWDTGTDGAELRKLEVWRQYSNGLISSAPAGLNNPGFENGDTGWETGTGWEIVNDSSNAAEGIYAAKASGASIENLTNNKLIPVAENDRILAHCLAKKTAGAGNVRIKIAWLDINQSQISGSDVGDVTTSSTYVRLRILKTAPASTAFAKIQADVISENSSTVAYVDKFEGTIIPKDVDIDALQTTNAPAEASATNNATGGSSVGDNLVDTAAIVDAAIENAKIADLAVDDAKINDLDAGKITAGIIDVLLKLGVAENIELDGSNEIITIKDNQGTPQTRGKSGKLDTGSTDWGIEVLDSSGTTIFKTSGSETFASDLVDALQTTNAPAEANADKTSNQNQDVSWLNNASLQATARTRNLNNLIENPGAEDNSQEPHEFVENGGTWDLFSSGQRSGDFNFRYDSSGQAGTATFRANGTTSLINQHPAVSEGDQVVFEEWHRLLSGTGNRIRPQIRFVQADGTTVSVDTGVAVTPTGTWTRAVHSATAPANTAYVVFETVIFNDGNTGSHLFDDLFAIRMTKTTFVEDAAITGENASFTSGTLSLTTSFQDAQTVSITIGDSDGGGPWPIHLVSTLVFAGGASNGSSGGAYRLLRDSSVIYGETVIDVPASSSVKVSVPANLSDAPGAGTYTYKLQARKIDAGDGMNVRNRSLIGLELKDNT